MPRGVGLCRGFVSALLSVQWGFSQLREKLAFSPRLRVPWAFGRAYVQRECYKRCLPHQSHTARAGRSLSVSKADLKTPQLANAAKVRGWHVAWPWVCFICETVRHLNVAVNNLARVLGGKRIREQLRTSPLPEIKYFTSLSPVTLSLSEQGWWSLSLSAGGSAATADSTRAIDGRLSRPYWDLG